LRDDWVGPPSSNTEAPGTDMAAGLQDLPGRPGAYCTAAADFLTTEHADMQCYSIAAAFFAQCHRTKDLHVGRLSLHRLQLFQ